MEVEEGGGGGAAGAAAGEPGLGGSEPLLTADAVRPVLRSVFALQRVWLNASQSEFGSGLEFTGLWELGGSGSGPCSHSS